MTPLRLTLLAAIEWSSSFSLATESQDRPFSRPSSSRSEVVLERGTRMAQPPPRTRDTVGVVRTGVIPDEEVARRPFLNHSLHELECHRHSLTRPRKKTCNKARKTNLYRNVKKAPEASNAGYSLVVLSTDLNKRGACLGL